jgi:aflatoxin B1 aldehyde reductase
MSLTSPQFTTCSGGFFAGKVTSLSDRIEGRFDPNSGNMGAMYRARYLNNGYFEALRLLKDVAVST